MQRWQFDRCGGHLAIDFANTVSARHTGLPIEHINTYDDLVEFGAQSGIISGAEAARMRRLAERAGDAPARVQRDAVALREALHRTFRALAAERTPAADDLAVLNAHIARLALDGSLRWAWTAGEHGLDVILGPIVRAAVELLTSEQRGHVRMCSADDCMWTFLDTSKNQSRRWCDMKQCGNRAKVRRFYARQRRAR